MMFTDEKEMKRVDEVVRAIVDHAQHDMIEALRARDDVDLKDLNLNFAELAVSTLVMGIAHEEGTVLLMLSPDAPPTAAYMSPQFDWDAAVHTLAEARHLSRKVFTRATGLDLDAASAEQIDAARHALMVARKIRNAKRHADNTATDDGLPAGSA